MMFKYDPNKVPDVKIERDWVLQDKTTNQVYRVGNWSFESSTDADIQYSEEAIYAWIAWRDFLAAGGHE